MHLFFPSLPIAQVTENLSLTVAISLSLHRSIQRLFNILPRRRSFQTLITGAFAPTYTDLCQRNIRRFDSDEVVFTSSNSIAAPALATMATIHRDREKRRQGPVTPKIKRRSAAKISEMSPPGGRPVEEAGGVATAAPAPGAATVAAPPAAAAALANRRPRMETTPGQNEVEHALNFPDESPRKASIGAPDRERERYARGHHRDCFSLLVSVHCLKPDLHR